MSTVTALSCRFLATSSEQADATVCVIKILFAGDEKLVPGGAELSAHGLSHHQQRQGKHLPGDKEPGHWKKSSTGIPKKL